jgi:hypothetical protein
MDEPVVFKGDVSRPGLYYVETNAYFPLRGNGWYSQPVIEYCLAKGILQENEIKYVIYAGLVIKKEYFKPFIDEMRKTMPKLDDCDLAKLAINSMIGCFKPKEREHWKTLAITDSHNDAMRSLLGANGCFVDERMIGDKQYYQVYEEYHSVKDETEAPIYNMILDMEAVELHKLSCIVVDKGGRVYWIYQLTVSRALSKTAFRPSSFLSHCILAATTFRGTTTTTNARCPDTKWNTRRTTD